MTAASSTRHPGARLAVGLKAASAAGAATVFAAGVASALARRGGLLDSAFVATTEATREAVAGVGVVHRVGTLHQATGQALLSVRRDSPWA